MNQPATAARTPFQPTAPMIQAAEDLFLAMAFEQSVRPIVEGYQRKILAERTWHVAPNMLDGLQRRSGEAVADQVTDIKDTWTMLDTDFADFHKRCNDERIAAGLHAESDDHCPLLVAENLTRIAKHALCDATAAITGIPGDKAVTMPTADYEKLVDLALKLLAPYVKNPLAESQKMNVTSAA